MTKNKCSFCNSHKISKFLDLGNQPLANSYLNKQTELEQLPLAVSFCEDCSLVQLTHEACPNNIFQDYSYLSSYSQSWLEHSKQYVNSIIKKLSLTPNAKILEVGSNDGYLLQFFKEKNYANAIGIEPASNIAAIANAKGIHTINDFFNSQSIKNLEPVDLLIANNVFAHSPDINDFAKSIKNILKTTGIATIEAPHLLNLIKYNQFDTIYHEHYFYYSLISLTNIFNKYDMQIFDVELLASHGGSLRIYLQHTNSNKYKVQPIVQKTLDQEVNFGLNNKDIYHDFANRAKNLINSSAKYLKEQHAINANVVAYGAPAKGNTFLNTLDNPHEYIKFTVDQNPYKQNRYLPGSNIPIFAPSKLKEAKIDTIIILPWNLKQEITKYIYNNLQINCKTVCFIPELIQEDHQNNIQVVS